MKFAKEKRAEGLLAQFLKSLGGVANTSWKLPVIASTLGIGGAGLLGGYGGYHLANMQDNTVDPEEAKRQELVAAYRSHAERARRKAQTTSYRQPKPAAPKLLSGELTDGL